MNRFIPQKIISNGLFVAFCLLYVFCQQASAAISHDLSLEWKTLNSRHFEIHFHNGEQDLAEQSANIAEQLLKELEKDLNWKASDIIEIVITDEQDFANGFVHPLLTHLRMTIYPTAPNENFDYDNWLELLIKHELTHVLHLDKSKGNSSKLKNIFGRHPLLFPNLFQPLWLIEGYATFQESDIEAGTGRGQSSFFRMMMRTEVKNGIKPLNQVNLNISSWPIGTTRYLYGYYFYEFLEKTYGNSSISDLIENYSNNLIPYRLNHNTEQVFGKTFPELWQEFSKYLTDEFQNEITNISSNTIKNGEQITSTGYLKLFAQPLDNGNLLYAEYDAMQPPRLLLKKFNIDRTEYITDIQPEAKLDTHPTSGVLVSQIEIYRNTNAFYDLFHVDLKEKDLERLTRGDRFRNAVWNPKGDKILAIYNKLGRHSLVLLNREGRLIDLLWQGQHGEYLSGIDWSPDSKSIVTSIKRNNSSWNLEEFNLAQRSWRKLTNNSFIETQPQYSHDGKYIFYSADYNGVFNIQKLDVKSRSSSTISNVMGGAFSPRPNNKNELYYIGYTANGFDIFKLENTDPIKTKPIQLVSEKILSNKLTYKKTEFEITEYSTFSRLKPTWWTPTISGDKDSLLLGAYTSGSDALNRNSYDAYMAYDFRSTSLSGELNYSYDRWFPLFQTHLETIGRQDSRTNTYQFETLAPLISRDEKFYVGVNLVYEKSRETIEVNGEDTVSKFIDPLLGFGAIYDSRRRETLSISPSHGRLISLTAETSDIFGSNANGQMVIGKWKEYISFQKQHVLAFRFIGGFGLQNPRPFQLGGSIADSEYQGSSLLNSLPPRASLYNKRRYALRGYPSDAASLVGRRMLMYTLEWRFPLEKVERSLNMFPAGLHQISSTIFAESASAWEKGTTPQDFHYSLGFEIHFHTELFYFMPILARLGYAYGIHEDGEHQPYFSFSSSF